MSNYDALIIGAGSAGLMCASRLCFYAKKQSVSLKILVVDSNSKIGKKLAITGNGRCNMTNLELDSKLYNSDDLDKVNEIYSSFDVFNTLEFFNNELSLLTVNKDELVYPVSLKSSQVIDNFNIYLADNDVEFVFDSKVTSVKKLNDHYEVTCGDKKFTSSNVVFATGGCSYKITGSDGFSYKLLSSLVPRNNFTPVKPSLVQLVSNDKDINSLSGIRMKCDVSLFENNREVHFESGEMLFTDNGISGICVMQLSRFIKFGKYHVICDLLPDYTSEFLISFIRNCKENYPDRNICNALRGVLLDKVICVILQRLNIDYKKQMSLVDDMEISKIVSQIKEFRITVSGTEDIDRAQVTSGGLNVSATEDYLEVKNNKGLYACGEVLNVDGPCGGYNLQWAWSSADYVAKGIIREF